MYNLYFETFRAPIYRKRYCLRSNIQFGQGHQVSIAKVVSTFNQNLTDTVADGKIVLDINKINYMVFRWKG